MPCVFPVACHTDYVGKKSTFVAIAGLKSDGVEYIPAALQKGATTIVVSQDAVISDELMNMLQAYHAKLVRVENTRRALAQLSAQAAEHPAQHLKLIAITGTKGKTTSSFLLAHILESAGYNVALLSTAGNRICGVTLPAPLTTAQPDYLHQFFKLCVEHKVTYVVMEVAAQAVSLHRVHGLLYDAVLFTNFSEEHGEFYASMSDYFAAKTSLFDQRKVGAPAFINADDVWCEPLVQRYSDCFSMSMYSKGDIRGLFVEHPTGIVQGTVSCQNQAYPVTCTSLFGDFNAYNSMGVVGVVSLLGLTSEQARQGFATFSGVPGRLAHYRLANGASCYIDYAHNPSSYKAVLSTLRKYTDQLIVVFGAGGDRDPSRRPVMGALAAQYAHTLVLTTDNPRSEDPVRIIQDIYQGIPEEKKAVVVCQLDREQAIKHAYSLSRSGGIIAVLGKGTDNYQIIGNTKTFFSDTAVVQSLQADPV